MPKDNCSLGKLDTCTFINPNIFSQYGKEVIQNNQGDGNLLDIVLALRQNKEDLFLSICKIFKINYDEISEPWLTIIGSMLGISRINCGFPTIENNEIFKKIIEMRIFELNNIAPSLRELEDLLKSLFGEDVVLCFTENRTLDIFPNRKWSDEELKYIDVIIEFLPTPCNVPNRVWLRTDRYMKMDIDKNDRIDGYFPTVCRNDFDNNVMFDFDNECVSAFVTKKCKG